jgi:hypothetical protein
LYYEIALVRNIKMIIWCKHLGEPIIFDDFLKIVLSQLNLTGLPESTPKTSPLVPRNMVFNKLQFEAYSIAQKNVFSKVHQYKSRNLLSATYY